MYIRTEALKDISSSFLPIHRKKREQYPFYIVSSIFTYNFFYIKLIRIHMNMIRIHINIVYEFVLIHKFFISNITSKSLRKKGWLCHLLFCVLTVFSMVLKKFFDWIAAVTLTFDDNFLYKSETLMLFIIPVSVKLYTRFVEK